MALGEITGRRGAAGHAGARYRDVSDWERQPDAPAPQPWGVPLEGAPSLQETVVLAAMLSAFTTTPQYAYFCLWEGHGDEQTYALASCSWRIRAENGPLPPADRPGPGRG